jgi:uncharacterized protein (DUF362 family)
MKPGFHYLVVPALLLLGIVMARAQTGSIPSRPTLPVQLTPVIMAERPGAVHDFNVDAGQARQMVNNALLKLTSASDLGTAWTRLGITPQDIVGIKIATAGGTVMSTHPPIVQAICDGLAAAGVPAEHIIIWDKLGNQMTSAGYPLRAASLGKPAIASVVPDNFDPNVYYRGWTTGSLMWGDYRFSNPSGDADADNTRSYFAKFVTETCTKLINVPVLTDNIAVGINGCLSTLALGSVDNTRRLIGPPTYGTPAIDEILFRSYFRRKTVVHILDALVAQCAGGPNFDPQYCQDMGAIFVSRDPVAIDSLVFAHLENMRHRMGVPLIGPAPVYYIKAATLANLGTTNYSQIQLVRIH